MDGLIIEKDITMNPLQPIRPSSEPPHAPTAATVTEGSLAHLEYLGYDVGPEADGWSHAHHPYRFTFHLRTFAGFTQLHCSVSIGASLGNSRAAWLDFLNDANNRGFVTRFSLFEDEARIYCIRMRALVSGAYSRSVFAVVMDMWQEDLDMVRLKPAFPSESGEDVAAVSVDQILH